MATQYIAAWKDGTAVVWKGLSWAEYRTFSRRLQAESPIEVYIDLYRALVVEGPDVGEAPAGVVEFVAKSMLETNPFGGQFPDIQHALTVRRDAQDYLQNAKALVAGIFRYTFEEIDTWDADTFFDRVAKAEFLAGKTLDPENPAEVAAALEAKRSGKQPPQRRKKKPLTEAQQMVLDRVRETRR